MNKTQQQWIDSRRLSPQKRSCLVCDLQIMDSLAVGSDREREESSSCAEIFIPWMPPPDFPYANHMCTPSALPLISQQTPEDSREQHQSENYSKRKIKARPTQPAGRLV